MINTLTPENVAESTRELARRIRESQIVMIPGGFSGGDEPDGSAKFITAFFRAPEVTEAVRDLLQSRDGLMLGICNGFQALVKLGLVPYGDIVDATPEAPTLTFNEIGRHQSRLVRTRICSDLSPWLSQCDPDGSAKFITAFFRAPEVTEAVRDLLQSRDGLMLGICNGFQALVKLGLVPYGDIVDATPEAPTLTFNEIGRHQSRLVRTRICSDLSPWLSQCDPDELYTVAISHGEGRFVASDEVLDQLRAGGQIATQYVDVAGMPSMDLDVNPNGSVACIEGITSPDGRVFGKMGHVERRGDGLYKNVPGEKFMPLCESGVAYFG